MDATPPPEQGRRQRAILRRRRPAEAVRATRRRVAYDIGLPRGRRCNERGAPAPLRRGPGMTGPAGEGPDAPRFALTNTPDEARRAEIARGLREFNQAQSPELF